MRGCCSPRIPSLPCMVSLFGVRASSKCALQHAICNLNNSHCTNAQPRTPPGVSRRRLPCLAGTAAAQRRRWGRAPRRCGPRRPQTPRARRDPPWSVAAAAGACPHSAARAASVMAAVSEQLPKIRRLHMRRWPQRQKDEPASPHVGAMMAAITPCQLFAVHISRCTPASAADCKHDSASKLCGR